MYEHLSATIRRLREARHLTRSQLAERAAISASTLVHIEIKHRWDIQLSTLAGLARGLDLTLTELMAILELEVASRRDVDEARALASVAAVTAIQGADDGVGQA